MEGLAESGSPALTLDVGSYDCAIPAVVENEGENDVEEKTRALLDRSRMDDSGI